MDRFKAVRDILVLDKTIPGKYRDHPLKGEWSDHRECHIEADWLLIYRVEKKTNDRVVFVRMGSHSDLFE